MSNYWDLFDEVDAIDKKQALARKQVNDGDPSRLPETSDIRSQSLRMKFYVSLGILEILQKKIDGEALDSSELNILITFRNEFAFYDLTFEEMKESINSIETANSKETAGKYKPVNYLDSIENVD